jgi:hypothetical protein
LLQTLGNGYKEREEEVMDVNIQATIGNCDAFQSYEDADPKVISVVIAPLKLNVDDGTGKMQIISGCNMFRSCYNPNCWYSMAARQKKKERAGK